MKPNIKANIEAKADLTAGLGLRLCENCRHLDDSEEGWNVCNRPNYPAGKNWNRLVATQRYVNTENTCYGRYWVPNAELCGGPSGRVFDSEPGDPGGKTKDERMETH